MELENGNLHVSSNRYSGANEIDFVCAYHLLILFFIKKKIVTYFKRWNIMLWKDDCILEVRSIDYHNVIVSNGILNKAELLSLKMLLLQHFANLCESRAAVSYELSTHSSNNGVFFGFLYWSCFCIRLLLCKWAAVFFLLWSCGLILIHFHNENPMD